MGSHQLSAISTPTISEEANRVPQPLRAASYWALAVMFVAVYVGSLFSPPLLDDADSTHAEAAREMFVSGDYVTLHVNGVRYLEKAPLPYWMVAFWYHIFGVNEFASRLPMALSVLLLGVLAVAWGRRAFGERAGIYAGLLVYTSAGDAVATMSVAGLSQDYLNARAAVSLAALPMDLDNLLEQTRIFQGPWAGLGLAVAPVVVAAGGYFQGLAKRANGMVGFHRVNPLKPLVGGSERMPKVFFKISRCWRR